jgi:hypothetical protein
MFILDRRRQYLGFSPNCMLRTWETKVVRPKVSVLVAAYNSAAYIEQALDGILMQRRCFPMEIVVHDDASTDSTPEILRRYRSQLGDELRVIRQSVNQYSRGVRILPLMAQHASGEYLAICDADDYWRDADKLSTQVDILDAEPTLAITFCNVQVIYEDGVTPTHAAYSGEKRKQGQIPVFTVPQCVTSIDALAKGNYIHTPGVVFRNTFEPAAFNHLSQVTIGDWPMFMLVARTGDIRFVNELWATYRVHSGGVFSSVERTDRLCKAIGQYRPMLESGMYDEQVRRILMSKCAKLISELLAIEQPVGKHASLREPCWHDVVSAFPELAALVAQQRAVHLSAEATGCFTRIKRALRRRVKELLGSFSNS